MDACTTSPVEANNNAVKHGPSKINARMNLDKSTQRLIKGINDRFARRRNMAKRELNKSNTASSAPTSPYLIEKGQGLIDRYHDHSHDCKCMILGQNDFIVTDWYSQDISKITSPYELYQPKFYRVRKLHVTKRDGKYFVWCSCGVRQRVGVPCPCFFALARSKGLTMEEIVDIGMVDVRYLKLFNAHYGDPGKLGRDILDAQEQCAMYQDLGVQVSTQFAEKLLTVDEEQTYPILGKDTTEDDLREATYVLSRDTTTRLDMALYRISEDESCDDVGEDLTLADLADEDRMEHAVLTDVAARMKSDISESIERVKGDFLPTDTEVFDMRKDWTIKLDAIMKDERGSKELKEKVNAGVLQLHSDYFAAVDSKYGKRGGGVDKMEMYSTTGGTGPPNERFKRAS